MSCSSSTTSTCSVAASRRATDPSGGSSGIGGSSHYCRAPAGYPLLRSRPVATRVLVIDNYDSFVYNLVQYLGELGTEPLVHRHDELPVADLEALEPDAVLISPGPGTPDDAGVSNEVISTFAGRVPVLGVCLGHQCIGQVYGGEVVRAPQVMHGKTSLIRHHGTGVFAGLPEPL